MKHNYLNNGEYYSKSKPLNTCGRPMNESSLTRLYPRKSSKSPNFHPTFEPMIEKPYPKGDYFETQKEINYGDSYCNQGMCRGNYPVPFSNNCGVVPPAVAGSCYPYTSILQLISKIIRWKYSGVPYNVLGYMFYEAFLLYYNPDQSTPYFVTDYTFAILNSILVGNFATEVYNNDYPPEYYDTVIEALKRLQYRITDYDFRFQFNGQLCCYLVQSIPDPPEVLNYIYNPQVPPEIGNNGGQMVARGGLF